MLRRAYDWAMRTAAHKHAEWALAGVSFTVRAGGVIEVGRAGGDRSATNGTTTRGAEPR